MIWKYSGAHSDCLFQFLELVSWYYHPWRFPSCTVWWKIPQTQGTPGKALSRLLAVNLGARGPSSFSVLGSGEDTVLKFQWLCLQGWAF